MTIYTVYFKEYSDDYYAPHNRSMFINREDADIYFYQFDKVSNQLKIIKETLKKN